MKNDFMVIKKLLRLLLTLTVVMLLSASLLLGVEAKDTLQELLSRSVGYKEKIQQLNNYCNENYSISPEKSLIIAKKIVSLSQENNYPEGVAMGSLHLGRALSIFGNYSEAFNAFTQAQKYYHELGMHSQIGSTYNSMANTMYMSEYYDEALVYFKKSLEIKQQLQDSLGVAIAYSNMGECFLRLNQLDSALRYSNKGLQIEKNLGNTLGVAISESSIAYIKHEQGRSQEAINDYLKATRVLQQHNDYYYLVHNYSDLARVYLSLNQPEQALPFISKGFECADSLSSDSFRGVFHKLKSEGYDQLGNHQKALEHYKFYDSISSAISNTQSRRQIAELQTLYELEKKEGRIALLSKENAFNRAIIFSVSITLLLILLVSIITYKRYLDKKKATTILQNKNSVITQQKIEIQTKNNRLVTLTESLKELDEIKTRFFTNISHEFRTPLTLIIAPAEQLASRFSDETTLSSLQTILHNARNLMGLINQLLSISRMEKGNVKIRLQKGNIEQEVGFLVEMFRASAQSKGCELNYICKNAEAIGYYDKEKIEAILYNLLSNALKNTKNGSIEVAIEPSVDGEYLNVKVSDTGRGIEPEKLPYIFDRFYMANEEVGGVGSGVGLAFTRELVNVYKGGIDVQSALGQGTTFSLRLPFSKSFFADDEVELIDSAANPEVLPGFDKGVGLASAAQKGVSLPANAKTILLVEDHDELRGFIAANLRPSYNVIEAENGREGLDRAINKSPDLIITDVMMPGVDGIELARTLKGNEETSHIPIIMLTAKASEESKITGLQTQVDDYLTKPFSVKELVLRVSNILAIRERLRARYQQSITVNPSEITTNSVDEQFIARILGVVEENMAYPMFSVDTLCQRAGVSRSNLHNKLTSLLNQSATEFINTIRVKRAAQLIRGKAGSISEIAYDVGFNNLSYFTKVFRKHFGCTPSQMATGTNK